MPTLRRGHLPTGTARGIASLFAASFGTRGILAQSFAALSFSALAFAALTFAGTPAAVAAEKAAKPPAEQPLTDRTVIAAVVNGDVITNSDITNRARMFALTTGLPMSAETIDRLRPQILKELIDEKLRLQEAQRRKIVVGDNEIATALKDIEARNSMAPGALRAKLTADGVSPRTLIDQIRVQLAWQDVLKTVTRDQSNLVVSDAEVNEMAKALSQRTGQMEYRVAEIFIPVDDPSNAGDAQRFAETVISELHAGAPFPLVAAQFSQTQSALQGGELGWVQTNQLDPAIAKIVTEMPVGAVSNPVRVPGGFDIVTLVAKREIGNEVSTVVTVRQAFFPFTTPLDPQAPTEQQKQELEKARSASATINSCDQMEAYAKANNPPNRPMNPGEIAVASVNPPSFRQLVSTIPLGKATQPLVSRDGIAVLTVCSREEKNIGEVTPEQVRNRLINERVEMMSRTLVHDLHRRANIDIRGNRGA